MDQAEGQTRLGIGHWVNTEKDEQGPIEAALCGLRFMPCLWDSLLPGGFFL